MDYIGEGDAPRRQLKACSIKDLSKISTLGELEKEGYKGFSVAPIHCYAGIEPGELSERFAAEIVAGRPEVVEGAWLEFAHSLVARCDNWGRRLEVMDLKSYPYFKTWLSIQIFVSRADKNVRISRLVPSPILDPFAIVHGHAVPSSLDLFTSSSSNIFLEPKCWLNKKIDAHSIIDLQRAPPEGRVLALYEQVFGEKAEGWRP